MPILETWDDYQAVAQDQEWRLAVRNAMDAYGLSVRERDVVWQLLAGLTNKEIAYALCLEENTVKNYLTAIAEKTGTQGRMQLALRVLGVLP